MQKILTKQNTIDIDLSKTGFKDRIFHVCKISRESGLAHNRRSTDNWNRTLVFCMKKCKIFREDRGRVRQPLYLTKEAAIY